MSKIAIFRDLCIGTAALAAVFFFVKLSLAVNPTELGKMLSSAQRTMENLEHGTGEARFTLATIREASTEQQRHFKELTRQAVGASREINKTLNETTAMMKTLRTDTSAVLRSVQQSSEATTGLLLHVDSGVIPRLETALSSTDKVLLSTNDAISTNSRAIERLVLSANSVIDMPELKRSVSNMELASAGLATTSGNVAETTGLIRDAFKPTKKNFWHNLTAQLIPATVRLLIPASSVIRNSPTVKIEDVSKR